MGLGSSTGIPIDRLKLLEATVPEHAVVHNVASCVTCGNREASSDKRCRPLATSRVMVWCRIGIADSRSDLIEPDMLDVPVLGVPCYAGGRAWGHHGQCCGSLR